MTPTLGRMVHAVDHQKPEKPAYAAVIARVRRRNAGDRPAPDRGADTVYPEDLHVVDLSVLSVDGVFSVFEVDYAPDPSSLGHDGKPLPYHEWSWSWPERV
jgi:hypothetical protein